MAIISAAARWRASRRRRGRAQDLPLGDCGGGRRTVDREGGFGSVSAPVTVETALQHGLTADEYRRVETALGRPPTLEELGVFSVMWSEHCSYKSSRAHLRSLPTTGPRVLQRPGEHA